MIYLLLSPFYSGFGGFERLHYIVCRACLAAMTAFLVSALAGRRIVPWLRRKKIGEKTECTAIQDQKLKEAISQKSGTPTMGGIIFMVGLLSGCFLWGDVTNIYLHLTVFCTLSLSLLGMVDDWCKLTGKKKTDRGLKARQKLIFQFLIAGTVGLVLFHYYRRNGFTTGLSLFVPIVSKSAIYLGAAFVVWIALVITTTSNATNITDGVDGLLSGLAVMSSLALGAVAYCAGRMDFSEYLRIPYVAGGGELTVFCAAMAGACLGFLWWNAHPASVFMGDTGALAIGGGLGCAAIMVKQELLLPFIAMVFYAEFGSSLLQIFWFKLSGQRIFPIAPVHHWAQKANWAEPQIVTRFTIVGTMFALFGLSLLRL